MAWVRMGGGASKKKKALYYIANGKRYSGSYYFITGSASEIQVDGYIQYNIGSTNSTMRITFDTLDFKGYDKLHLKIRCTATSYIGFSDNPNDSNQSNWNHMMQILNTSTPQELIIPLNNAHGYLMIKNGSNTNIYDMYFGEKAESDFITYLYEDGKQNVAWDNTNYTLDTPLTEIGGAMFNPNAIFIGAMSPSAESVTVGTNDSVDLTEYKKLKAVLTYHNQQQTIEMDVSSIIGKHYISLNVNNGSYYGIGVSTQKKLVYPNRVAFLQNNMYDYYDVYFNRIWLEK